MMIDVSCPIDSKKIVYRENNFKYSSRVLSTPTIVDESLNWSSWADTVPVDMETSSTDQVCVWIRIILVCQLNSLFFFVSSRRKRFLLIHQHWNRRVGLILIKIIFICFSCYLLSLKPCQNRIFFVSSSEQEREREILFFLVKGNGSCRWRKCVVVSLAIYIWLRRREELALDFCTNFLTI